MRRNYYMGRALQMGAIVGCLVGTLAAVLVVGWLWLADVKEGTDNAAKMVGPVALVCQGGSTVLVMLLYAIRCARESLAPVLQQNQEWDEGYEPQGMTLDEAYGDEEGTQEAAPWAIAEEPAMPSPRGPDTTLGDRIVQCMYMQAEWRYAFQRKPTRAAFEKQGVPQPIWNSGRDLLRVTGVVMDTGWADLPWATVQARLERTHVDPDRIWVVNGRTLTPVQYTPQLINNRYTRTAPPQDAV